LCFSTEYIEDEESERITILLRTLFSFYKDWQVEVILLRFHLRALISVYIRIWSANLF
jgi:hypothetical protein